MARICSVRAAARKAPVRRNRASDVTLVARSAGLVARPATGRVFPARRSIRLSDMDSSGRLRLDAVARYLQDIATDDVEETGWGAPDHLWVVRHIKVDVLVPFLSDRAVELETWCSGEAAVAAGRRWSLRGGEGGSIEVDSVWIHLDAEARPARLVHFGAYAEAAAGRRVSTKLSLEAPSSGAARRHWPLRVSDVDVLGHVNNAAYWQAVEQVASGTPLDLGRPYSASVDFRSPLDLGDAVELATCDVDGALAIGFYVGEDLRAVARIEQLASRQAVGGD
jgi:acyl-ACP thioesterase